MEYSEYFTRAYNETKEALIKEAFDLGAIPAQLAALGGQAADLGAAGVARAADWGTGVANAVTNAATPTAEAVSNLGQATAEAVMADPAVAAGAGTALLGGGLLTRRLMRRAAKPAVPSTQAAPKKLGLGRKALLGSGLIGMGMLAKSMYDKQHA